MNRALFLMLLPVGFLIAEGVSSANMYPATSSNSFTDRPADTIYDSTSTTRQIEHSNGTTTTKELPPSTIDTTYLDSRGHVGVSSQVDFTNALDMEKLYKDRVQENLGKANAFSLDFRKNAANKFKDKNGNAIDPLDPTTFSQEAITKNFSEDSDTRSVLAFQKELYQEMRAKLIVDGQIQCYITRKVNSAYYCPLPGHGTADFGGGTKDSQEYAQKKCDSECRVQTQCMEYDTGDPEGISGGDSASLPIEWQEYVLNPGQVTKEFSFSYEPRNINDIQDRYFEDGLVRGRVSVKGIGPNNNEITLYDGYVYEMKKEGGRITLEINQRLKSMMVYFYDSYIFDPRYMDEVALYGDNPEVIISDVKAGYKSNKRYFCPIYQFVADAAKCDGTLKFLEIGGGSQSVCVPRKDLLKGMQSEEDGGYFTEDSCLAACWEEAKCVPTYRHLAIDPNNLATDMYDIEYGCVDSEDNKACTKERCRAMFEEDVQPSKEVVWEKDSQKVVTVDSGVVVSDKMRPRIDFQGEMGANGSGDRQPLFNEEMKDYAYQQMIRDESFNVSKNTVSQETPDKYAADVRVNGAASQISFNLLFKARSSTYDTGTSLYVYPVIEVFSSYAPYKPISYQGRTYYPENDRNIKAMDSVLLIYSYTMQRWVPFNRKLWLKYYLPKELPNGEIVYKWFDTPANTRYKQDIYYLATHRFVAYGAGYKVPGMGISFSGSSDLPWEEYPLFLSLSSLLTTEGILLTNANATLGKIYDYQSLNTFRRAHYFGYKVYGIASTSMLDLRSIAQRVSSATPVYDSRNTMSAKTEIVPDSQYDDGRVKIYTYGDPDKKSAFVKISPKATELEQKGLIFMFLHE